MRKIKLYLKNFYLPILLLVISIVLWFNIPDNYNSFKTALIASVLGVGISIFTAMGFNKNTEQKRIKRTFGLLKIITIPYLKGEAETTMLYLDKYKNICDINKAKLFISTSFDLMESLKIFDKSWLNLIYSQKFLDTIQKDSQFNTIANAISEVLLFTTNTTKNSLNLQRWQNLESVPIERQPQVLDEIRRTRNQMDDSARKLLKFSERLEKEIDEYLEKAGVSIDYIDK